MLINFYQVDGKDKDGIARDTAGSIGAIAHGWGQVKGDLATLCNEGNAGFPAFDKASQVKLHIVCLIEDSTIGQRAFVVYIDFGAGGGMIACAYSLDFVIEASGVFFCVYFIIYNVLFQCYHLGRWRRFNDCITGVVFFTTGKECKGKYCYS